MQDQMKNMPPEQRERIEAMMKGRGMASPGGAAMKTEYRKTGSDRVGKWACDKYEGYRGDQKVSELCTVNPSVLGVTAADFEIARQAAKFFEQLAPQNADQMFSVGGAEQGFSGIPVRSVVRSARLRSPPRSPTSPASRFPTTATRCRQGSRSRSSPADGAGASSNRPLESFLRIRRGASPGQLDLFARTDPWHAIKTTRRRRPIRLDLARALLRRAQPRAARSHRQAVARAQRNARPEFRRPHCHPVAETSRLQRRPDPARNPNTRSARRCMWSAPRQPSARRCVEPCASSSCSWNSPMRR